VRRSPEFIARTVLLPERFRVDCAVGGDTVALSQSRCDYNATRARLARQSSLAWVVAGQRKAIVGQCAALQLLPRAGTFGGLYGTCLAAAGHLAFVSRLLRAGAALLRVCRGGGIRASLREREMVDPGRVGCRFFLHLIYFDRFVNY
jgi:hypothetical protein